MVKSGLCFRPGNLHVASSWGREGGGVTQTLCRCPKVETKDRGEIDTPRGQHITLGGDSCGVNISTPQKFVARRAEKFQKQGGRLCLAALEMAYVFGGIAHAEKDVVANQMLPQARAELSKLEAFQNKPEAWGNGEGYWDDYCLCRFLEGICERYLAYPVGGDVFLPMMSSDPHSRTQMPKVVKSNLKINLLQMLRNARKLLSRQFC